MRIGRGYRDWRDIELTKHIRALLRRSQNARDYGNPYISYSKVLLHPELVTAWAAKYERIHRSTKEWKHYHMLRSANHGYTVVLKDNIVTARLPTTCASRILRGFRPPRNATVTRLLERAGMLVLAKTNMDEFGMGSHSLNSAYGEVHNGRPYSANALSVGGSSGGSALAVADHLAHVGIGTDTGGSIRLPAAYMSLVGFKPSYGMISRNGVVPYANSLDTVGIVAKTTTDVSLTFDFLQKPDKSDPTCLTLDSRRRLRIARNRRRVAAAGSVVIQAHKPRVFGPATGASASDARRQNVTRTIWSAAQSVQRIGVPVEYNIAEMHPLVRWAWVATLSHLETRGCEIVPISLPSTKHALSAYYILAPAEASSNLAKYDGVRYGAPRGAGHDDEGGTLYSRYRGEHFGPEVQRRILLGAYSLSAGAMDNYFIQAQKIRRMVQEDFDTVFRMPNPLKENAPANEHGVDYIVVPTAPSPPPRLRHLRNATPVESYMNDVFTVPASLAGLPAISVPGPRHPDHPWQAELAVGMQVIGQYGDDHPVITFAHNFLSGFHKSDSLRRLQDSKIMA